MIPTDVKVHTPLPTQEMLLRSVSLASLIGWVGIIYHTGFKNYEHYTPSVVEGTYRNWEKCCEVHERLAEMSEAIGVFRRMGVESLNSAVAQFQKWEAHAESLKQGDKLLQEPDNYEIENFFDADNIAEFAASVAKMQYAYNADLPDSL